MGKSDFFSFGDEDPEATVEDPWVDPTGIDSSGAVAVAPPPDEVELAVAPLPDEFELPDGFDAAHEEKGAGCSRGDSTLGSSAKRKPPSLRVQAAVVVALLVVAVALVRIALVPAGADNTVASSAPPHSVAASEPARTGANAAFSQTAEPPRSQEHRQGAAERQRVRQKKAQTRRRAKRRRAQQRAGRRHAEGRRDATTTATSSGQVEEVPAPAPEGPTESLPPEPEPPAPVPSPEPPASEPSEGGGLHDGSSSPEFGL
jgi:hypothetical protein